MECEVVNRLLAGPAEIVDSRVDHKTNRAEVFTGELAEPAGGLFIDAKLRAQRFGIQRPAFSKRTVRVKAAEVRKLRLLTRDRPLENKQTAGLKPGTSTSVTDLRNAERLRLCRQEVSAIAGQTIQEMLQTADYAQREFSSIHCRFHADQPVLRVG